MTEAQHQAALFKWSKQPEIRKLYPELALMYHIPNEGNRTGKNGAILRSSGMKRGVPDICLPVTRRGHGALYVEMKVPGKDAEPHQQWWIDRLTRAGNCACVCHGWESAVEVIFWYLGTEITVEEAP